VFFGAALLALGFAIVLFVRSRNSSALFYRWWTVSFTFYTLAFVMEALTVSSNWHLVWEYQLYIIGSAGLVGAMSVGTTYLALPKSRIAHGYAMYYGLAELALIVLSFAYPPVLHGSWTALNAGQHAIVGPTQVVYLLLSAVGGPIVVIGALVSWWKTRRYYTLLIAVGALIPSFAGTFASQNVATAVFPLMNVVGLLLIFLGYLNAGRRSAVKVVPNSRAVV
jgi:hypothetical protein